MSEPGPGDLSGSVAGEGPEQVSVRPARDRDIALLYEMFRELAEYEKLLGELQASEDDLKRALFGPDPLAYAVIAEQGRMPIGYAVFYRNFSSFLANGGVWLEDLYVRPPYRGVGAGRALLAAVAQRTREMGGKRLEWAALDWNELALGFYRNLGAVTMQEWITHRLAGEPLEALAAESSGLPVGQRR